MTVFIGIDGFPGGWVSVSIDHTGAHSFDYSSRIDRLLGYEHDRAMIDIPIGLLTRGYRLCDEEAQDRFGSRIFTGARRNLWTFPDPDIANAYYWSEFDKGISRQLWCIREKIREVDEFITPERQQTLQETHPELVFWQLNQQHQLESKHTPCGRDQRLSILQNLGLSEVDRWLRQRERTGIRRDDLLDACACAIAARDATHCLPLGRLQIDARGLRMEIWY